MAPPQEQAPLASTEEDLLPISLTDRISALGQQSLRLPEGWKNFNEEEFDMLNKDVLAGAGINKSGLPEGWTTVITRKKRKRMHTLPNVPEFLVGTMYNHPSVQEPEDEWEWELTIHARTHNLMSHDNFDVLEKLPPIPRNRMFPETVPQDVPDDDDDEEWTRIISACIRNLQSLSEILIECDDMVLPVIASSPDLGLKQSQEMGLPDLGGLPEVPTISGLPELPSLSGLPDIPDLPYLPDDFDDLEERLGNFLTFTRRADDDALASGAVPNLGIEVNRNDIPELDLANVPGAVPTCGVEARKKEVKKIQKEVKKKSKKVKKQPKKEADRHDAVAKKKKEKAQELRESIDYCERKPEALQFAIDVNKKQPIEKEQCHTEDTEKEEKKKEKTTSFPLFAEAMMGVIMTDIKKGNEKAKRDAEAERAFRYASDTSFVLSSASTGRQSGLIGGFEAFGAVAMAISEGSFHEDNSGTREPERECPYQPPSPPPPPPPPPKRGDNIRMPYGDVLKSDAAWNIF